MFDTFGEPDRGAFSATHRPTSTDDTALSTAGGQRYNRGSLTTYPIALLEGLDCIRRRPGLYLTSASDPTAASRLLTDVLRALASLPTHGTHPQLEVRLEGKTFAKIRAIGVALPTAHLHHAPLAEWIVSRLSHRYPLDPKHRDEAALLEQTEPLVLLNGVSRSFRLTIDTDGRRWIQTYELGRATSPLTGSDMVPRSPSQTTLEVELDPSVLPHAAFDAELVQSLCTHSIVALPVSLKVHPSS